MNKIGTYQNREIWWADYVHLSEDELPNSDWICLFTASTLKINEKRFDEFVRSSIKRGVLEFKGHGKFGELLHDLFDETMVDMEIMEKHPFIDISTTCHNDESFADAFWQCFFATALPERADYENLKIICSDLDGISRINELTDYLERFKRDWIPGDESNTWEPINYDNLRILIKQGKNKMTVHQLDFWNQIEIEPEKWQEREFGNEGNGFWIVGHTRNKVVWYNDIEEGFNISNYNRKGLINDYGAEQDELQWTLQKLKNDTITSGDDSISTPSS